MSIIPCHRREFVTPDPDLHLGDQINPATCLPHDVLINIFELLDDGPVDSTRKRMSQRDLYLASLVCQVFKDPALDILWQTMTSITPLLQLIPGLEVISEGYIVSKAIDEAALERFQLYSHRIKHFVLDQLIQPMIVPFSQAHLSSLTLPQLSHWECTSAASLLSSTVFFLLSSSLQQFKFNNVSGTHTHLIKPFLCTLQGRVPALKHLIFEIPLTSEMLGVVRTFRRLWSLQLTGSMDVESFREIVTLPELRILILDITDKQPLVEPRSTDVINLSNLHTLKIKGHGAVVISYLSYLRNGDLQDVSITIQSPVSGEPSASEIMGSCLVVLKTHWSTSLQLVSLKSATSVNFEPSTRFSTAPFFIKLRRLDLDGWNTSETRWKEFLPCFPALIELKVHGMNDEGTNNQSTSLDFLHILAQSCPSCIFLELKFKRSATPDRNTLIEIVGGHGLKMLCISTDDELEVSNLEHPTSTAQYLDHLFPDLHTIKVGGDGKESFWKHVYAVLQTLQYARRTERVRIQSRD